MTPAAPTRSDADVIATDQATPPKTKLAGSEEQRRETPFRLNCSAELPALLGPLRCSRVSVSRESLPAAFLVKVLPKERHVA